MVEWIENVVELANGTKNKEGTGFAEISLQMNAEIIRHMNTAVMNMRNENEWAVKYI